MTEIETHILEQAIETVYERPDQHGEPEDSFADIADFWSDYLETDVTASDVAMLFILMKVARSKNGVYDQDNPVDIAGYAENYARLMNNSGDEQADDGEEEGDNTTTVPDDDDDPDGIGLDLPEEYKYKISD